jgi:UDP-N-acetylmuramoylalanine--D-glutamate ligase
MTPETIATIKDELRGNLAVVVGAGVSGLASCRLLLSLEARVRLLDAKPVDPALLGDLAGRVELITGPHERDHFAGAALVVLSPGVPIRRLAQVLEEVPPWRVVAEMELSSWFTKAPAIAITGTNGKTTTVSLVAHILRHAGLNPFVGGNIGDPLAWHVAAVQAGEAEPASVLILEISSFQLQTCRSFAPRVGALLNFSANHLDWHADMEEYLEAKLNLFAHMRPEGRAILPASMAPELAGRPFTKARILWYAPQGRFSCPNLVGEHNQANMEAAFLCCEPFGVTEDQAREAMLTFSPPGHRIQFVAEKNGVRYVDDSKATTVEAVMAAVKSFDAPVRLLLGGVFKGGDVEALARVMAGRVVSIGLFGGAREEFEPILSPHFPCFWTERLSEAVARLAAEAAPGDVVLLSPATASFDQYSGYKARGDDFRKAVEALP